MTLLSVPMLEDDAMNINSGMDEQTNFSQMMNLDKYKEARYGVYLYNQRLHLPEAGS